MSVDFDFEDTSEDSAQAASHKENRKKRKPHKIRKTPEGEKIHAMECVVNSQCNLSDGCRGRLKATAAINGNVQIFCPTCRKFAEGVRPLAGLMHGSIDDPKLMDRYNVGG